MIFVTSIRKHALNRAPVLLLASLPLIVLTVLIAPIALAKAGRGKLSYGSGGAGAPSHLAAELFLTSAGVEAAHIPYKSAVQAITALLGKEVDFAFPLFAAGVPHVQSGRIRSLAVTGASRNPRLAQVPTFAEAGVTGVVVTSWSGVSVPAGTPVPVVARILGAVHQAIERPAVRAKLEADGARVSVSTLAQFTQIVRDEILLTEKIMKAAKIESQ